MSDVNFLDKGNSEVACSTKENNLSLSIQTSDCMEVEVTSLSEGNKVQNHLITPHQTQSFNCTTNTGTWNLSSEKTQDVAPVEPPQERRPSKTPLDRETTAKVPPLLGLKGFLLSYQYQPIPTKQKSHPYLSTWGKDLSF